jgi:hypothetical protein
MASEIGSRKRRGHSRAVKDTRGQYLFDEDIHFGVTSMTPAISGGLEDIKGKRLTYRRTDKAKDGETAGA